MSSASYRRRVEQLPEGSVELRRATHGVLWRLPNGAMIMVSLSRSEDPRASANHSARIRRLMREVAHAT